MTTTVSQKTECVNCGNILPPQHGSSCPECGNTIKTILGQVVSTETVAPENEESCTKTDIITKSIKSFEEIYVYTLCRDGRDIEGKLLRAGTRVLCHPDTPDQFFEDTDANRRIFKEKHYAVSDEVRQSAWFPPCDKWSESLETEISRSRALCHEFIATIDNNVVSSVGSYIPDINLSPMLYALAWMPKIRKVEIIVDLSDKLIEKIYSNSHVPEEVVQPLEWQNVLHSCNSLKIYSLNSHFGNFHVVSAFVTPFKFSASGEITFTQTGSEIPEMVQSLYSAWCGNKTNTKFTFYTIGSSQQWQDGSRGVASSNFLMLLSAQDSDKKWKTDSPPQFAAGLYIRNFIERLYPETHQQKISKIKTAVDRYTWPDDGNILLDKIAKETGYRRTIVKEAFKAMQGSEHYECYKVDGKLAIRSVSGRKAKGIRIETETGFLKYHFEIIAIALLTVLIWKLRIFFGSEKMGFAGILIAVFLVYIGKCIETVIKRNQKEI